MSSLRFSTASDDDIARFASVRTRDARSLDSYLGATMHATHRICAYDAGSPVGVVIAHQTSTVTEIIDLYVDRNMRDHGIGAQLLRDVVPEDTSWRASAHLDGASQAFLARSSANDVALVHALAGEIPKDDLLLASIGLEGEFTASEMNPNDRTIVLDLERLAGGRASVWLYDLRDEQSTGVTLWQKHECVGYAYLDTAGQIGPLRVASPSYSAPMLAYAMHTLRAMLGVTWVRMNVPAANSRALSFGLGCGMRLDRSFVRAASRSLGDLATYVGFLPFAF